MYIYMYTYIYVYIYIYIYICLPITPSCRRVSALRPKDVWLARHQCLNQDGVCAWEVQAPLNHAHLQLVLTFWWAMPGSE